MLVRLICCFAFLLPGLGEAGPWPRANGKQFLSLSYEATTDDPASGYSGIYYERGLPNNWTFGFDGGADGYGYAKAILFARKPAWHQDDTWLAWEVGMGQMTSALGTGFALRSGLSIGKATMVGRKSGWMSLDVTSTLLPLHYATVHKAEATIGFNFSPRGKAILQATYEHDTSAIKPLKTLTPSIVWRVKAETHIQAGAVISKDQPTKAKIGLWFSF